MSGKNPGLTAWAIEQQRERQETSRHESFAMGVRGGDLIEGAGGFLIETSCNRMGKRTLKIETRPVLLGKIEVIAELATQAPDQEKGHRKTTHLIATPEALRALAHKLIEAADAADEKRPRPTPVR